MSAKSPLAFGPFRLEPNGTRLYRDEQIVPLRPRSLAVLHYLAEHAGRLVSKEELLQKVWERSHVTATVLRVCIREIREALGDSATTPRYIETVESQGYRFCGRDLRGPVVLALETIVGRQRELEFLDARFQRATHGQRQCLLISAEPGLGKTTLVEWWLNHHIDGQAVRVGRGQCGLYHDVSEAYRPWLEALSHLVQGTEGNKVLSALRQVAPMWLVHLPALVDAAEQEHIQRRVQGATPARMLRELYDALERLSRELPLVLVLEDLHWSDALTVEALAALAARPESARLMVVGTYRPSEAVLRQHALRVLRQELLGHGQCEELHLELLTSEDVAAYASARIGGSVSESLTSYLYDRTEGNPLFMVNVLAYLVQQNLVVHHRGQWTLRDDSDEALRAIPEGLRQFILRWIEILPLEEQRLLEAASVAGQTFAVATVAAGVQGAVAEVEGAFESLVAQSPLLEAHGLARWPDSTVSGQYRFRHALYQQVIYERLGAARRVQLHREIGARLEAGYGASTQEIAHELTRHFARGHAPDRELPYQQYAGEQALRRFAYQNAIHHLRRGLELVQAWPESVERWQRELALHVRLGMALLATKGFTDPETGAAYHEALTLSQQLDQDLLTFPIQHGLFQYYFLQGRFATARQIAEQLLQESETSTDAEHRVVAHRAMGAVLTCQGRPSQAREHLELSLAAYHPATHAALASVYGLDFKVFNLSPLSYVLWIMGFPDQARQCNADAIRTARELGHPFSLAQALCFAAGVQQLCGDVPQTQALSQATLDVSIAHDFAFWQGPAQIYLGWSLAAQGQVEEGLHRLQQGLIINRASEIRVLLTSRLALLAQTLQRNGEPEAAWDVLTEAFEAMQAQDELICEPELYRLKGELLRRTECGARWAVGTPETCFEKALDVARQQQAKSWELRAAISLARLWQQQSDIEAARNLLTPIYHAFTEGFDTADLQAAKTLLQALD